MITTSHIRTAINPAPWIGLAAIVALWGTGVFTLAQGGAFQTTPGAPPFPVLAAVATPVLIGIGLWRTVPALRDWVGTWDLATLVALQSFRVIGIVFLFVWWLGLLPTLFAWVAGLGDISVGVLAIGTTLAVARGTPGWRPMVRRLTFAGLADFAVVVTLATLSTDGNLLHFAGEPTPAAMQHLPLIMIPGFLVPINVLLLLAQLHLSRALSGSGVASASAIG